MALSDVDGSVAAIVREADADRCARAGEPAPVWGNQLEVTLRHLLTTDPAGCLLGEAEGGPVGMAVAIRRDRFWGLAFLFVRPSHQGRGVGRELLAHSLHYAQHCETGMIMSSTDQRAMRRYALSGFRLTPTMRAIGSVDKNSLANHSGVRPGSLADLDIVETVDEGLRPGSRVPDVEFLLTTGAHIAVIDRAWTLGYVVYRDGSSPVFDGHPILLGAQSRPSAEALLSYALSMASVPVAIHWLTASHQWAIDVAIGAALRLEPFEPVFLRGREQAPSLWIGSGVFF